MNATTKETWAKLMVKCGGFEKCIAFAARILRLSKPEARKALAELLK